MAQRLERYGADLLLIPCNDTHHFYDQIQKKIKIPILHILRDARRHIQSMNPRPQKVGLMASGSTVKAGIYQKAFQGSRIQLVLPEPQE